MTHGRLHGLTDGIFAIVMTLMVLELKLPAAATKSNESLWHILSSQYVVFLSYFISFAILYIYWRAHNFVVSILAKNIDINLLNINAFFLFLVGLVPYTTHVLGVYSRTSLGITVYALNVVGIGLTLVLMRYYIERATTIENLERTHEQRRGALIRISIPIVFSALAIPVSFINTQVAFIILLFAVFFNFHNNAADLTQTVFSGPIRVLKRFR
ncbi:MAG: TMEM175 family protein [Patescibacteria group bacterium]|nr:TMEM175 family protein [Patescibacteria group bacterium]